MRPAIFVVSLKFVMPQGFEEAANSDVHQGHFLIFFKSLGALSQFLNADQKKDAIQLEWIAVREAFGKALHKLTPLL